MRYPDDVIMDFAINKSYPWKDIRWRRNDIILNKIDHLYDDVTVYHFTYVPVIDIA
jgi:hypothetical protein